ncbi:MAG: Methyltransferase domain [Crocinitomicaceae bacterium]|jgi:SAM-dependent methyltransferase|nr:Methyltransferase domain [Crocinitomicaceae bacterium]
MVEYNKEKARQEYEKRYSTFTFVPGYQYELAQVNRFWRILNAAGVFRVNPKDALDLGSGFGFKTYALSKKIERVTGIDISSNAILISNTLNDNPNLEFICTELEAYNPQKQFDLVTAFGLSNFNVSDVRKLADEIHATVQQLVKSNGVFVLYSTTDFSGKAPSGWYYHSKSELKQVISLLKAKDPSYGIKLIFPHRSLVNYRKQGVRNFLFELFKLFSQRKKEYLISITRHD